MAYVSAANFAGAEASDPALQGGADEEALAQGGHTHPSDGHKPSISEYRYYARIKRQSEREGTDGNGTDANGNLIQKKNLFSIFSSAKKSQTAEIAHDHLRPAHSPSANSNENAVQGLDNGEKEKKEGLEPPAQITVTSLSNSDAVAFAGLSAEEVERAQAHRALRVAGWTTITYLITTDILGPFNAPYAIANMGMVPGVCCYVFFGLIASGTAYAIGYLYNQLDSDRYPIKTYGDIAERLCGKYFRHGVSILQSIQLIVNVGIICLSSGQSLYQVSKGNLCQSVCVLIIALAGMLLGQIRSLRNYSVVGQTSVFLNLTIIFLSLAVVCRTGVNYVVANNADQGIGYGPVVVAAFNSQDITGQINGMFNIVFAYGGAMIFPEMISEMRRPMDFWKGMLCADALIMTVYMVYGVVWFTQQGQYTQANAFQGLNPYWAQTVCNVLNIITSLIAAGLYGNIGVKIIYINIFQNILGFPPINTKRGRIFWSITVPIYWALAFVIGSSVPALGAMTGLVGAICIFHFTYTFPPLLLLSYFLIVDGSCEDLEYTGYGTLWVRKDSWRSMQRWRRAWFARGALWFFFKVFLFGFFLACLACFVMGAYGTGVSVQQALQQGAATSFGCAANA